jgi:hypothetical protein
MYFDSNRVFTVILCIQAYLDRGYFWALFQLPPRYYLQEYITLQKLFQLPPAIIYKNI